MLWNFSRNFFRQISFILCNSYSIKKFLSFEYFETEIPFRPLKRLQQTIIAKEAKSR
jgi:hypothetical protein